MTEQEQIEEMTKLINSKEIYPCEDDVHCENCFCSYKDTAEKLYNAGYRKIDDFEAEDERLREVIRQLNTDYNRAWERLKSDYREIGELKSENKQLKTECALLDDELRIARQDTIDVLNKLKTKSYVNDYCREVVEVEKIDELIKELITNAEDKS